jgi:hypothetical protein
MPELNTPDATDAKSEKTDPPLLLKPPEEEDPFPGPYDVEEGRLARAWHSRMD